MIAKLIKKHSFTDAVVLTTLVFAGGFHEYISCLLAVALSIYLIFRLRSTGKLHIEKSIWTVAVGLICLGYGVSCFWAVDPGMAFVGFLKFLPLMLFLIALWQQPGSGSLVETLPIFGALLTVLTAIGMQFGSLGEELFGVAGRLAGSFQYPNTFAVFLLVCELLALKKPGKKLWDYLILTVLIGGLLYTGSRTVFVLAVASNFLMLLLLGKKRGRLLLLAAAGAAVLAVVLLALGGNTVLRRYLTISFTESTFVGRILYWMDALPLLLKYPFGMGYMGYYYIQGSIQTGVYSVAYIHNDFLQLLLDVGLIPGGVFFAAVISYFCRKGVALTDKLIVATLCLHCLFDFDLQFLGIFFLLLVLAVPKNAPVIILKASAVYTAVLAAVAALGVYMGTALGLARYGIMEAADAMYPYNTRNKLAMLEMETDIAAADALAKKILAQNTAYYAPYSIRAKYAYSQGDFVALIENKHLAFEKNPFGYTEYEEYCVMLINGITLYEQAGDTQSADFCRQQLLLTKQMLASNKQRLSTLGAMIDDQPETELPEEIRQYIGQLEGGKE